MNFEFLKRVLSASVLFPLLVILVLKGNSLVINLTILICLFIAWFEWSKLFNFESLLFFWGLISLILVYSFFLKFNFFHLFVFTFFWAFLPFIFNFEAPFFYKNFFVFLLGIFYLFLGFFPFKIILFEYPRELTLFFFCVVFANDTGAYLSGKFLGKRPFIPKISPKKTWEGFWGGMVLALLVGWMLNNYFHFWDSRRVILVSFVLALFGVMGDLFESAIKRAVGKKDSGALIPGHGGLLDRIDGVLFASPVFLLLLEVFPHGTYS
ncbi:MAG: phosphatidate cytidylyltransferase [Caldimicrobium sp.]|jgi:phosphatidate cytidylyltransferase|uniref:Phosphatidate cytidylyltransferase n=1 Tax=Caldimicrobium thiodismutans TaxID=1653476 RepID=A0A2N7PJR0_9BACT|nr:MAG: hypothetical protein C0197_03380 [Caldimicrobium thiodismutans]